MNFIVRTCHGSDTKLFSRRRLLNELLQRLMLQIFDIFVMDALIPNYFRAFVFDISDIQSQSLNRKV